MRLPLLGLAGAIVAAIAGPVGAQGPGRIEPPRREDPGRYEVRRPVDYRDALPTAPAPAGRPDRGWSPAARIVPRFPLARSAWGLDGDRAHPAWWLGGDVAEAVVLDRETTFWIFSDTFIGGEPPVRRPAGLVSNSVALATTRDGAFTPSYFFRGTPEAPRPFFEDPLAAAARSRFWTASVCAHGGKLLAFLHRRRTDPDPAIGDRVITSVVARVNNPTDDPRRWRIDYLDLCRSTDPQFGAESLVLGEHVAVYGFYVGGGRPMAIRLPLSVVLTAPAGADLGRHAEYLAEDDSWKPGLAGPDCKNTDLGGVSGFSVRYNRGLGRWQAVGIHTAMLASNEPDHPKTAQVYLSSRGPFGPWEQRADIYRFPELTPGDPIYRPDAMCYAVRELEAFAEDADRTILFTYTNGPRNGVADWLFSDLNYYRIRTVEVANPFAR